MWDIILRGTVNGAIFALVAVGLNLQYGVTRILNVAHGQFLLFGSLITAFLFKYYNINPLVSLVISGPTMFVIGVLIYVLVFRRMVRLSRSAEQLEALSLLLCFGLIYVSQNVMTIIINNYRRLFFFNAPFLTETIVIFGERVELNRIVCAFMAIIFSLLMYIALRYTRTGLAMRATAEEPTGAQVVGINISKIHMISFGLSAFTSALAGSLLSMVYSNLSAASGPMYTFIALAVIVIGGMGSFIGSLIGGFLMGYVYYYTLTKEAILAMPVVYTFIIITLIIRPKGFFGR